MTTLILDGKAERIESLRLITARLALRAYIRSNGTMELTRGGTRAAMEIVTAMTGRNYQRGMRGKREALVDAERLLERCGMEILTSERE